MDEEIYDIQSTREPEASPTNKEMAGGAFGLGVIILAIAAWVMWSFPAFLLVLGVGCLGIGALSLRGVL